MPALNPFSDVCLTPLRSLLADVVVNVLHHGGSDKVFPWAWLIRATSGCSANLVICYLKQAALARCAVALVKRLDLLPTFPMVHVVRACPIAADRAGDADR